MHFSTTLAAAMMALGAHAAFPVASIEFESWEDCDIGYPVKGEPKFKADVTATPLTCDKTTVNRDWSINNYAFKAFIDTKDALLCHGFTVWNTDDCSGNPWTYVPFDGKPVIEGVCLPDSLDPGFVSFKLDCFGFPGGPGGP